WDTLPVHLLTTEPLTTEQLVVQVLLKYPELLPQYAPWMVTLHPNLSEELTHMGRTKSKGLRVDVRPLVKHLGWQEILRQTGLAELIDQVGVKPIIDQMGVKPI